MFHEMKVIWLDILNQPYFSGWSREHTIHLPRPNIYKHTSSYIWTSDTYRYIEFQRTHNTCFWTNDVVVWVAITLGAGRGGTFGAGLGGSLGGTSGGGLEWVGIFVSKALIFSWILKASGGFCPWFSDMFSCLDIC